MTPGRPWLCSQSWELPDTGRSGALPCSVRPKAWPASVWKPGASVYLGLVSPGRNVAAEEAPSLSAEAGQEGRAGCPSPSRPRAQPAPARPLLRRASASLSRWKTYTKKKKKETMMCLEIKNKAFKGLLQRERRRKRKYKNFQLWEKSSQEIPRHLALFALACAKEKMKPPFSEPFRQGELCLLQPETRPQIHRGHPAQAASASRGWRSPRPGRPACRRAFPHRHAAHERPGAEQQPPSRRVPKPAAGAFRSLFPTPRAKRSPRSRLSPPAAFPCCRHRRRLRFVEPFQQVPRAKLPREARPSLLRRREGCCFPPSRGLSSCPGGVSEGAGEQVGLCWDEGAAETLGGVDFEGEGAQKDRGDAPTHGDKRDILWERGRKAPARWAGGKGGQDEMVPDPLSSAVQPAGSTHAWRPAQTTGTPKPLLARSAAEQPVTGPSPPQPPEPPERVTSAQALSTSLPVATSGLFRSQLAAKSQTLPRPRRGEGNAKLYPSSSGLWVWVGGDVCCRLRPLCQHAAGLELPLLRAPPRPFPPDPQNDS